MKVYGMEIEGLWVDICYDYYEGCDGDRNTTSTPPRVNIRYWELAEGEEEEKDKQEISEHAWDCWMFDIDEYVYNHAEWDIIEYEESFKI